MAASRRTPPVVTVEVTPRFEVFYALQVLEGGAARSLGGWRRDAEQMLGARVRTAISNVAPSSLMWPLLADSLKDGEPAPSFDELLSALRKMRPEDFQRSVLSGVFKSPRSVARLLSRSASLQHIVETEAASRGKLLSLLGLNPYVETSASVRAFERMIAEPNEYRNDVANVLDTFWNGCFNETWSHLEPKMERVATRMHRSIEDNGFDEFARRANLPLSGDRSSTIYIIPSAFNTSRLWAAYEDVRGRKRVFIPLADPSLSLDERTTASAEGPIEDPAAIFKALGDTTRYAMVSAIARTPMTSIELARMFGVSKPTISHHVQALRAANLLIENPGDNGVVLSVNRRTLENASSNAAREMFSSTHDTNIVKRTRRANRSHDNAD
jgi:ArsR family transcriptional regulator